MELKEIIQTQKEVNYTTYFYHKNFSVVYKVITDGKKCALSIRDELGLSKCLRFGAELPKYILKKL